MATTEQRSLTVLKKEADLVRDAMRHPGIRIIARRLRRASKLMMLEYDTATMERIERIKVARWFINDELPRIIDSIVSLEAPPQKREFSIRNFLFGGRKTHR